MKPSSPREGENEPRALKVSPSTAATAHDEVRRLFLSAAWISAPGPTIQFTRSKSGDVKAWNAAAALSRRVSQEPLWLRFLKQQGMTGLLAPEAIADLENQSRFHAFRWAEIHDTVQALLESFEREGVRPVLLKGIAFVGECYEPPRLRPMRDVDILVRQADLAAAREAAGRTGFLPDPVRHPEEKYAGHHHLPPLFHRDTHVCLKIHHHVLKLPRSFEGFPPVEEFWSLLRESRLFPGRASILEPSLEVLNTCVHITHGDSIGRRAQNILDLARVVEAHREQIDWERLLALASQPDAARALFLPLLYLAREGLAEAPPSIVARLGESSGLERWETDLVMSLISRYRLGSPPGWPLISGRVSNILWRLALRRGSLAPRGLQALWQVGWGKVVNLVSRR